MYISKYRDTIGEPFIYLKGDKVVRQVSNNKELLCIILNYFYSSLPLYINFSTTTNINMEADAVYTDNRVTGRLRNGSET